MKCLLLQVLLGREEQYEAVKMWSRVTLLCCLAPWREVSFERGSYNWLDTRKWGLVLPATPAHEPGPVSITCLLSHANDIKL